MPKQTPVIHEKPRSGRGNCFKFGGNGYKNLQAAGNTFLQNINTFVYQFNDMINLIQLYRKCTQQIPTNKNQSVVSQKKKKKKRKPIS